MSHFNNLNDFNVNIDDYSVEELIELLEFTEDPSKEEIVDKVNYLNENHFKGNNNLRQFFYNVQNKLLNYFENSETTYLTQDILPNNNLIESMANLEDEDDLINTNTNTNNNTNNNTNTNTNTNTNINEDIVNINERYSKYKRRYSKYTDK